MTPEAGAKREDRGLLPFALIVPKPCHTHDARSSKLRAFCCCAMAMEEGFLDKLNEFRAGRTLFEIASRQGFRENSNFNFAARGA